MFQYDQGQDKGVFLYNFRGWSTYFVNNVTPIKVLYDTKEKSHKYRYVEKVSILIKNMTKKAGRYQSGIKVCTQENVHSTGEQTTSTILKTSTLGQ